MSQIRFYAFYEDLKIVFQSLQQEIDVKYAVFDHFDSKNGLIYSSYAEIPDLCKVLDKKKIYLIFEKETTINPRLIKEINKYAFDQLFNPHSITIEPGGFFNEKLMISGVAGSCSINESASSKKMFNVIQKHIKKNFKKVKAYWVGECAYQFLLRGGRLSYSNQAPPEYDLKVN